MNDCPYFSNLVVERFIYFLRLVIVSKGDKGTCLSVLVGSMESEESAVSYPDMGGRYLLVCFDALSPHLNVRGV